MTDAVTLLKEDHRNVEGLFFRYETLGDGAASDGRKEVVEEITRELSIHASVEEQVFYPAVRKALTEGDQLAGELTDEHQEVKEMLADLEKLEPSSVEFDPKVRLLISNVRHHIQEEEGEILPKIQSAVGSEVLQEMGEAMEKAKRTAPTHPHPNAPSTPPANLVAGPPAAALDRMRDAPRSKKGMLIAIAALLVALLVWRAVARRGDED